MTEQKVSLIVVGTGRYTEFLPALLAGAKKNIPALDSVFVISDVRPHPDDRVTWLPWGHLPWPYPTLLRYRAITAYARELMDSDVLLYVDVDMRFERELVLPYLTGLLAVEHPGYAGSAAESLPFERRHASRSCVPAGEGVTYFAGGVQGGAGLEYLTACATLAEWIQDDLQQGIIPAWHDESAWNRLLAREHPECVLSPRYCTPESDDTRDAVIVALNKNHYRMRQIPRRDRLIEISALWARRVRGQAVLAVKRILSRT